MICYNNHRLFQIQIRIFLAGMGYRKALEFLIKDYLIKNNPDTEEGIKKKMLSTCIEEHIVNDKIKMLAKKTNWLGNDETHFLRRYGDKDETVEKIKKFIEAILYYLEMESVLDEADSIDARK